MTDETLGSDHSQIVRYERLKLGRYFADFRRDKRLVPEVYHCVIQREGSNEILRWTQHHTLEEAIAAANNELRMLAARSEGHREQYSTQAS